MIEGFLDKARAVKRILGVQSVHQLVDRTLDHHALILGDGTYKDNEAAELAEKAIRSWPTWKRVTPTNNNGLRFIKLMLDAIGLPGMTSTWYVECPYAEFYRYLTPERQCLVSAPAAPMKFKSSARRIYSAENRNLQSMVEGLASDTLEQRFGYLTPRTALSWYNVLNDPEYVQGKRCSAALEAVLQNRHWTSLCRSKAFLGIVMLGGGASFKDRAIVSSAQSLQDGKQLEYTIVDYSSYIAEETLGAIQNYPGIAPNGSMEGLGLAGDFYQLADEKEKGVFRRTTGSLGWFIPGGTFGNLDEGRFLDSLWGVMERDDLLFIGVDTVPAVVATSYKKALRAQYKATKLAPLFSETLSAALDGSATARQVRRSLNQMKILLKEHGENGAAAVPGSINLLATVSCAGKKKTLFKSTRYREKGLVSFIRKHGFLLKDVVGAPSAATFKYFILTKG